MKNNLDLPLIESCVTSSLVPEVRLDRYSKQGRLTRALHLLGPGLCSYLHDFVFVDTLPVASNNHGLELCDYGHESIAWKTTHNGASHIFKIDRRNINQQDETRSLEGKVKDYRYFNSIFGDIVTPTAFCVVQQPYRLGKPTIARVQPYVEYSCDIFSSELPDVDPACASSFVSGLLECIDNGRIPDVIGHHNIVVTTSGGIAILDATHAITLTDQNWGMSIERINRTIDMLTASNQGAPLNTSA